MSYIARNVVMDAYDEWKRNPISFINNNPGIQINIRREGDISGMNADMMRSIAQHLVGDATPWDVVEVIGGEPVFVLI